MSDLLGREQEHPNTVLFAGVTNSEELGPRSFVEDIFTMYILRRRVVGVKLRLNEAETSLHYNFGDNDAAQAHEPNKFLFLTQVRHVK